MAFPKKVRTNGKRGKQLKVNSPDSRFYEITPPHGRGIGKIEWYIKCKILEKENVDAFIDTHSVRDAAKKMGDKLTIIMPKERISPKAVMYYIQRELERANGCRSKWTRNWPIRFAKTFQDIHRKKKLDELDDSEFDEPNFYTASSDDEPPLDTVALCRSVIESKKDDMTLGHLDVPLMKYYNQQISEKGYDEFSGKTDRQLFDELRKGLTGDNGILCLICPKAKHTHIKEIDRLLSAIAEDVIFPHERFRGRPTERIQDSVAYRLEQEREKRSCSG